MTTEKIDAILNSVSQRVEKLVPSGRFYVVLYESNKKELSFPLVREGDKRLSWVPRSYSPENILPDLIISQEKSLLYEKDLLSHFEKEHILYWPEGDVPQAWLGVPIRVGEQVLGALVVESWQKSYSFSKNDESTLTTVARQAAIAIENARLYEQLERKSQQLELKNENLRILNEMGQQLTRGLVKQEKEILELIYKSATDLNLDTRNMYIAFYDPDSTKPDTADEIYGMLRFVLVFDNGQQSSMRDRVARKGLTEYVIRTKKSHNPTDVKKSYQEHAPDSYGQINPSRTRSWLGVSMLSEGRVFGVIVLRNYEFEQVYTEDDQEMLGILAGQAAIALQNLHLFLARQAEQKQRLELEKMYDMGMMAAEFAHRMNNFAGTIPVRVKMTKELLDLNNPKNEKIVRQLEKIELEAESLLYAAQKIREGIKIGGAGEAPEIVNINNLIRIALERAKNTRINMQDSIDVNQYHIGQPLPEIKIERNIFLDTLTNIIKNGMEAINGKGVVTVKTQLGELNGRSTIEIEITDTGKGIEPLELPKIFDFLYTTKGDKGLGFGLWRDKVYIKKLGGEIDIHSEVNHGSTFIIRIPADEKDSVSNGK